MALTYTFFQTNLEDELWSKCLELYEEYTPIQLGGPLTAFFCCNIFKIAPNRHSNYFVIKLRPKTLASY